MDIRNRVRKALMLDEQGPGVWRTIRGTPVFIKEGQSVEDAVNERFGIKAVKVSKVESETLKQMLDKNGGFSYQPVLHSSPKDGYMVSPYPEREHVIDEKVVSRRQLRKYMIKNADVLSKTDHYFGAWKDNEKVYLDISVRHENQDSAVVAAKQHKQLAIFDVKNGKTIYIEKEKN
jgi:hypothetical protein